MTVTDAPLADLEVDSPVGALTLVASPRGLRAVLWPDDDPRRVPHAARRGGAPPEELHAAADQLTEWFAGERTRFDLALDPVGTEFQQAVWAELCSIPYGTTTGYGALGAALGRPGAARAVGAAVGRNPLSIVVPCHRVVGADGSLTGFAGGVDTKAWLLGHERQVLSRG